MYIFVQHHAHHSMNHAQHSSGDSPPPCRRWYTHHRTTFIFFNIGSGRSQRSFILAFLLLPLSFLLLFLPSLKIWNKINTLIEIWKTQIRKRFSITSASSCRRVFFLNHLCLSIFVTVAVHLRLCHLSKQNQIHTQLIRDKHRYVSRGIDVSSVSRDGEMCER